MLMILGLW